MYYTEIVESRYRYDQKKYFGEGKNIEFKREIPYQWSTETNPLCVNCPYGLSDEEACDNTDIDEWLEILMGNGYLPSEEEEES